MLGAIKSIETNKKMATLKWVHVVFLVTLRLGLSSGHRVLPQTEKGIYEANNFGFQLGGTWSSPFLGNGPVGGFLGFGSDGGGFSIPQLGFGGGGTFDGSRGFGFGGGGGFVGGTDGLPGFGFGGSFGGGSDGCPGFGGGGGRDGANSGSSGCRCECQRGGGAGDGSGSGGGSGRGDTSTQPWLGSGPNLGNAGGDGGKNGGENIRIIKSLTCRSMNCLNNGDCGGYHRCFDGTPPYWCDVPGFGVYPFWCPGGLDKSGQSSSCMPLSSPDGAARRDGYIGPGNLFRINGHGDQQNGAGESQEAVNYYAAGHN